MAKYSKEETIKMLDNCAEAASPFIEQFKELNKENFCMRCDPDQVNATCAFGGSLSGYTLWFSAGFALFNYLTCGFTAPFVIAHEFGHYKNKDRERYAHWSGDKYELFKNEFIADQYAIELCKNAGVKFIRTRAFVYLIGAMIFALGWVGGIKYLLSTHPEEDHPHPLKRILKLLL